MASAQDLMTWRPLRRKPLAPQWCARVQALKPAHGRRDAPWSAAKSELARLQKGGYVIPRLIDSAKYETDAVDENPELGVFSRERIGRAVDAHMRDIEERPGGGSLAICILRELNARRDYEGGHEADVTWFDSAFTQTNLVAPYVDAYRAAFLSESNDAVSVGWRILAMTVYAGDQADTDSRNVLRWDAFAGARILPGIPRIYSDTAAAPVAIAHPKYLLDSVGA